MSAMFFVSSVVKKVRTTEDTGNTGEEKYRERFSRK
jgi:hypothetical protein